VLARHSPRSVPGRGVPTRDALHRSRQLLAIFGLPRHLELRSSASICVSTVGDNPKQTPKRVWIALGDLRFILCDQGGASLDVLLMVAYSVNRMPLLAWHRRHACATGVSQGLPSSSRHVKSKKAGAVAPSPKSAEVWLVLAQRPTSTTDSLYPVAVWGAALGFRSARPRPSESLRGNLGGHPYLQTRLAVDSG